MQGDRNYTIGTTHLKTPPKLDLRKLLRTNQKTFRFEPDKFIAKDFEKNYLLEFSPGGQFIRSKVESFNKKEFEKTGKKLSIKSCIGSDRNGRAGRTISEFTFRSKKKMDEQFSLVDLSNLKCKPLAITLTFAGYEDEPDSVKIALQKFKKVLVKKFPDVSGIWKVEFTKLLAPHFHMVLFGVNFIPHDWLGESWHHCLYNSVEKRKENSDHLNAGTKIQPIRGMNGVFRYVSKYLGKNETNVPSWWKRSRYWGYINMKVFKSLQRLESFELTKDQHDFLRNRLIMEKNARRLAAAEKHGKFIIETHFLKDSDADSLYASETFDSKVHGLLKTSCVDFIQKQNGDPEIKPLLRILYDSEKNFIGFIKTAYGAVLWETSVEAGETSCKKARNNPFYFQAGIQVREILGYKAVDVNGVPINLLENGECPEYFERDFFIFLETDSEENEKTVQLTYANIAAVLGEDFLKGLPLQEQLEAA